jgi:hypothetical protein
VTQNQATQKGRWGTHELDTAEEWNMSFGFIDTAEQFAKATKREKPTREMLDGCALFQRSPELCYRLIDEIYPPKTLERLDNQWFHGPTGSGKSYHAHKKNPGAFIMHNMSWEGYCAEDVVIIENVEDNDPRLGLFLKIWADHYPFRIYCETPRVIRPKKIIVTSTRPPERLYSEPHLYEQLNRQFIVKRFDHFQYCEDGK